MSYFGSSRSGTPRRPSPSPGLQFESLETRCLLSISPLDIDAGLPYADPITTRANVAAAQDYLEEARSYLFEGGSDLELLGVSTELSETKVRFQQLQQGLPIHNAIVTVVQGTNGDVTRVYDHGHAQLRPAGGIDPGLDAARAESLVHAELDVGAFESSSQLAWYYTGNQARLSWRVETQMIAEGDSALSEQLVSIVDASHGAILSQERLDDAHNLVSDSETGIYPRIVINDTIGPAGARTYAAPFDAVAALALGCTGTLVAPDVVLSARHCGGNSGSQIIFGDDSDNGIYTATVASRILPAGGGSLLDGGDVSMLVLTQDVPANVATPMRLTEATDTLEGQVAATLGYGWNGVGSQGHQFNGDDIRWGGENIIDVYGAPAAASGTNIFSTDFDNGSSFANTISGSDPTPLEFEATTAPGDSGGPLLVQTPTGEWVIAGVLSGGTTSTSVYGDISWWTGVAPFRTQIEAVGGIFVEGGLGAVEFDRDFYRESDTIAITVVDQNGIDPVEVTLVSDSGDSETIALVPGGGGTYTGMIDTTPAAVAAEDGMLQVTLMDQIGVTYNDPDDGDGNPSVATAAASIANIYEFVSADVPQAIVDNQTITSTIEVSDVGAISDVDVLLDVTHAYTADLDVFLVGPDGTRVELFTDVGGGGRDFSNTILDDEASTPITSGMAPFTGRYSPEEALNKLDGRSITGTWTLEIRDDDAFFQGTLNRWELALDVVPTVVSGDFNADGLYDCTDIDALIAEIATGGNNTAFDLSGDGLVDLADRDAWLPFIVILR